VSPLTTAAEIWNRFFFAGISPASVAVFRIAFGVLLIVDAALLWRIRRFAFAPDGVLAIDDHIPAHAGTRFSLLHWMPRTMTSVNAMFALHVTAAAAITLGLLTPLAIGVAVITLLTLHHRNPFVLNSCDTILRLLCVLLLFSHSNAAFSVDAWIWPSLASTQISPWGQRLMQLLISSIYLKTVFWKLRGAEWRDGSAVYYALTFKPYERHALPAPLRRPWFYRGATWATLAIEASLGSLIWIEPLRYPVLICGVGFHLTMDYLLSVTMFQWAMLCALLLFVPPHDMAHAVAWGLAWIRS
jgi:hypothetical protein